MNMFMMQAVRIAGLATAVCLAVPVTANAGFFDFLFQPLHPPQAAQPTYVPSAPSPSFHPRKKAALRPKAVAKLHPGHDGRPPARSRVVTGLMDDDSLKNGDAVMTADGLRVFTGSSGTRHSDDDFAKLSEIQGMSKTQRSALLALDMRTSGAAKEPPLLDGRSVADPAAGEIIVDARGNKVRYVGP